MSDIFAIFHVLMSSTTLWPDAVTGTCNSSTGISFLFTVATLVRISRAWTVFPFTRSHLTDSGTNLYYTKEYHVSEIHHQGVAKIFQSHDVIHTKSNNMVGEVLGVLVAWVVFPDPPSYVGWICWFFALLREVFALTKNQTLIWLVIQLEL